MENQSEKTENELEEGGINSENEMDKTSEGNNIVEAEIEKIVKEKKNKVF